MFAVFVWNVNAFLRICCLPQIFPHWHLTHQASDYFGRLISTLINTSTHSSGYVAKWQRTLLTGSISRELRRGTSPCLVHISVSRTEPLISISPNIWDQMIEELYIKIPHTSGDHICGPQTLFCLFPHMFWSNIFLN